MNFLTEADSTRWILISYYHIPGEGYQLLEGGLVYLHQLLAEKGIGKYVQEINIYQTPI